MSLTDLFFMALLMLRELIASFPWLSLLIVIVLFVPWVLALLRRQPLRGVKSTLIPALIFALVSGVIAFFVLPIFFDSGLGHLRYLTDWLFHLASTASIMGYAFLVAIPVLLLMRHN